MMNKLSQAEQHKRLVRAYRAARKSARLLFAVEQFDYMVYRDFRAARKAQPSGGTDAQARHEDALRTHLDRTQSALERARVASLQIRAYFAEVNA